MPGRIPYLTGTMHKKGYVYIVTNKHHTVFYTGFTTKLESRIHQHKTHYYKNSFTDKYNVEYLVYNEIFERVVDAIEREKVIKKLSRQKKLNLINSFNPDWKDLWEEWYKH